MSKNSRNKKKVAGPKRRGKKSVKDLPAKGRGVRGGATNPATTPSARQTFGGAVLGRGDALNLGL